MGIFRTPRAISYDPQLIFEISSKIDFFNFFGPRKSQLSIFISKKNSIEFRKIIFSEFSFRPIGHPQIFASRHSNPKRKKTPAVQKSQAKLKSKIPHFPFSAPPPGACLATFQKKFDPREKFQKIKNLPWFLRNTPEKFQTPPTRRSAARPPQSRFVDLATHFLLGFRPRWVDFGIIFEKKFCRFSKIFFFFIRLSDATDTPNFLRAEIGL